MARQPPKVPNRSYDDLRHTADEFLSRYHPTGTVPVPVEAIIELELKLDIVPIPGLLRNFDIHAYVSRDVSGIWVDEDTQEDDPRSYRYSLAHELSHIILHRDIIKQFEFSSIVEWKAAITNIDEKLYADFEWQAHALGSLIVVPSNALAEHFEKAKAKLPPTLSLESLSESGRFLIADNLARHFSVPHSVMAKRMDRDRLWP